MINCQQIIDAAGRLMAERGLATPLEDIASAAGVGIATLYRRFPSRSDLIGAVFEDRLASCLADLEAAVAMADGWQVFVWLRSTKQRIADRALGELVEYDLGSGPIAQLREKLLPLTDQVVEHARASGRLRPDFTVADLAMVQHMLVNGGVVTEPVTSTASLRYLAVFLDGIVTDRAEPTTIGEPALTWPSCASSAPSPLNHRPDCAAAERGRARTHRRCLLPALHQGSPAASASVRPHPLRHLCRCGKVTPRSVSYLAHDRFHLGSPR